jgi:hypothetical protein
MISRNLPCLKSFTCQSGPRLNWKRLHHCFHMQQNGVNFFSILGGIPRHLLEDTTQSPILMLEAACADCLLDDCIKKIGINSTITEISKVIHSLIHVTSVPPFTESSVCYASQTTLSIIVHYKVIEAGRKMQDLLASCEGSPLTAALCGFIFEPYAIELLERGGTFACRQLVHGNTKIKPNDTTLYIPPSKKIVAKLSISFMCQKQKIMRQLMPGFLELVHSK